MYKKNKGFTLIELIVGMGILVIVMTMITIVAREVKYNANITLCSNNMKQISIAMATYYNDHKDYPKGLPYDTLSYQLDGYLENKKVFICPKDIDEKDDSYSQYYVYPGESFGSLKYIIGCPRHKRGLMTTNVFSLKSTQKSEVASVTVDSIAIEAGTSHTGQMLLEDGSKITSNNLKMQLVQSFRMKGGYLYSIIRVPEGEIGSISVEATTGSRLEIVTPSVIAAVRGTAFKIRVGKDDNWSYSNIQVTEGTVAVQPLNGYKKNNKNYVSTGKNIIVLKKSMSTKVYRKKARFQKKKIKKRIKGLGKKIRRGKRRGRKMLPEKALRNWLAELIGESGYGGEEGGEESGEGIYDPIVDTNLFTSQLKTSVTGETVSVNLNVSSSEATPKAADNMDFIIPIEMVATVIDSVSSTGDYDFEVAIDSGHPGRRLIKLLGLAFGEEPEELTISFELDDSQFENLDTIIFRTEADGSVASSVFVIDHSGSVASGGDDDDDDDDDDD